MNVARYGLTGSACHCNKRLHSQNLQWYIRDAAPLILAPLLARANKSAKMLKRDMALPNEGASKDDNDDGWCENTLYARGIVKLI